MALEINEANWDELVGVHRMCLERNLGDVAQIPI